MPEAPEVKITSDFIRENYLNLDLVSSSTTKNGRWANSNIPGLDRLKKLTVTSSSPIKLIEVESHGKFLWMMFAHEKNRIVLMSTLGMTGYWTNEIAASLPHAAFYMQLRGNSHNSIKPLTFVDQRRFGTIKITFNKDDLRKKIISLGPNPFTDSFNSENIFKIIQKKKNKNIPLCEIMMDQKIFCGVGNYIRAEAIWESRIDPWKSIKNISEKEINLLVKICKEIIEKSYFSQKDESISFDYKVYSRKTDISGNDVITKKDSNGRTLHWVKERISL